MRVSPIAAYVALSLVWGSEWLLALSLPSQPRLHSLAVQYGIAALLLLPAVFRQRSWRRPLRDIAVAASVGAGLLAVPPFLISLAAGHLSSSILLACMASVPVMLAIAGRAPIPVSIAGLAGVLFMTSRTLNLPVAVAPWLLLPILAAAVLAVALVAAERQVHHLLVVEMLFIQCVVAALILWFTTRLVEPEPMTWSAGSVTGLLVQGIVAVLGAYLLFYWLLKRVGSLPVSTLQWAQPLVTAAEAVVLHLRPEWFEGLGAALIIGAVVAAFACHQDRGVFLQITRD